MIISIDTEKAKEIQNPFMVKMLNKLITEEMYLNIIPAMSDKPTDNILKSKKMKGFLLRSGTSQECPNCKN